MFTTGFINFALLVILAAQLLYEQISILGEGEKSCQGPSCAGLKWETDFVFAQAEIRFTRNQIHEYNSTAVFMNFPTSTIWGFSPHS